MRLKIAATETAIIIFSIITMITCCSPKSYNVDSWFKDPPQNNPLVYWEGNRIPRNNIHKVIFSKQEEAIELLKDIAVLELNIQLASEFIGSPLPEHPNMRPYLVRGLQYENNKTGNFSVLVNGEQIRINFGCLGTRSQIIKQPLVIQLEQKPIDIFVTYSIAK